jgi:hypothetical protein
MRTIPNASHILVVRLLLASASNLAAGDDDDGFA